MIRFDNLPPEVMQAMCTPMHLIIPSQPTNSSRPSGALWLGSMSATMEKSVLQQSKISHIVQVLDVPWMPISEQDGYECYRIDILDIPSADLKGNLEGACKDIDKALRSGKNTLVHCQQVRPSPTLDSRMSGISSSHPSLGHIAQRGCGHRVPHTVPRHDLRLRLLLRQGQARLHQAE